MDPATLSALIDKGPVGLLALFVLWQTWVFFKKEDTKADGDKAAFSPVVDAFKTIVESNTSMIADQKEALKDIVKEMAADREFHRETVKTLVNSQEDVKKKVDALSSDLHSVKKDCDILVSYCSSQKKQCSCDGSE